MGCRQTGLILVALAAVVLAAAPRGADAALFEASSYPAELTGMSTEGARGFSIKAGEIECEASHYEGTLAEASSTLTVVPTYENCNFGAFSATVSTTGCAYQFHIKEEVTSGVFEHDVDVVCESGKAITITVSGCKVEIGPQSGLTAVTSTNFESGLTVDAEVTGIHYAGKGFICELAGIKTGNEGEYFDHVLVSGGGIEVGEEPEPEPTTLTTSLSGEGKSGKTITVNEGTKVKDQATLSGANAAEATGTVKYFAYADNECKELVTTAGEVSVSAGSVPASTEVALTAGAIYYWKATYSGDSKNQPSVSACGDEVLTVKAAVTLSTSLIGQAPEGMEEGPEGKEITIAAGTPVADTALLSGANSSKATGTVDYVVYDDAECKEQFAEAGEAAVVGGIAEPSDPLEPEEGIYYWRAFYSGGPLHQSASSACDEVLTVIGPTALTTSLSGEGEEGEIIEVSTDAVVTDTATLSGPNASEATGTVEYFVYADEECEELQAEAGEVEVEGASVPASTGQMLEPGVYFWRAVYSGDSANSPSESACGEEIQVVPPRVTTELSAGEASGEQIEVAAGAPVTDEATLHGENASEATGTVEYFVYADEECEELVTSAGEVEVEEATAPASEPVELEEPGLYYWQAEYSGDEQNPAAESTCGLEILSVVTPTTITTTLSGGEEEGAEIEVEEGTPISDEATLSGANAASAKGTVSYSVYADEECTELVEGAGSGEVVEGTAEPSEEVTLPYGTYYWQVEYFGDGVNQASVSTCGDEIAVVVSPVTTMLSGEGLDEEPESGTEIQVLAGTPVTDEATLHGEGASEATGTVEYFVYADEECEELVTSAGEVEVEGASVPASEPVELEEPGYYYWQAVYSDVENNPVAESTCGIEVARIVPPDWQYAGIGDSYSSGEGAGNYYTPTDVGDHGALHKENFCHRTPRAWPALVADASFGAGEIAEAAVFKSPPGRFIFRACSGAQITNIWGGNPKGGQYDEFFGAKVWQPTPAQAIWLPVPGKGEPNKKIFTVSLTIGGNDAGFGEIAQSCIARRRSIFEVFPYNPKSCQDTITTWEGKGLQAIKDKLKDALKEIRKGAPNAKIRLFLYPEILASNGQEIGVGPLEGVGPLKSLAVVNDVVHSKEKGREGQTAVGSIRLFVEKLNATIRKAAEDAGVKGVEVHEEAVTSLRGSRLGDPGKPWVNAITVRQPGKQSFHPNECGHKAIAAAVLTTMVIDPLKMIKLCE